MKAFFPKKSSLINAMLFATEMDEHEQVMVNTADEADAVFVTELDAFKDFYHRYGGTKFVVLLLSHRVGHDLPPDLVQPSTYVATYEELDQGPMLAGVAVARKYRVWRDAPKVQPAAVTCPDYGHIAIFQKAYKLLIVDDSHANLQIAVERFPGQQILPVDTTERALQLLGEDGGGFDAVLTDMNMRPDRMYPSLNLDRYGLTETVPSGWAIMIEATKRGLPVAIVTDANHHLDLFAAMFGKHGGATVNGQPVVFWNKGKQWDWALETLLKKDEAMIRAAERLYDRVF